MLIVYVLVVFVSSFLLAAIAVMVASLVLQRKQLAAGGDLELAAEFDDGPAILKLDTLSSITLWGNLLNQFDFVEGMRARIAQSELSWSVGRLTAMMLWLFLGSWRSTVIVLVSIPLSILVSTIRLRTVDWTVSFRPL